MCYIFKLVDPNFHYFLTDRSIGLLVHKVNRSNAYNQPLTINLVGFGCFDSNFQIVFDKRGET